MFPYGEAEGRKKLLEEVREEIEKLKLPNSCGPDYRMGLEDLNFSPILRRIIKAMKIDDRGSEGMYQLRWESSFYGFVMSVLAGSFFLSH